MAIFGRNVPQSWYRALPALVVAALGGPAGAVPLPPPRPVPMAGVAVPMPPPRPEEDGPPLPPAPAPNATTGPSPAVTAPAEPPPPPSRPEPIPPPPPVPDLACAALLSGGKVVAAAAAPISGPDGCGIAAPVTVEAVVLRDGHRVALTPAAVMRCDFADRLADWLRDDVATATADEGTLLEVTDAAAYQCRPRNWIPGARLSEHARGNAIDIVGFRFTRRTIGLKQADAHPFWGTIKASACARFATVLGPGSDGFHETNLHLDLEYRRSGAHLCQWANP